MTPTRAGQRAIHAVQPDLLVRSCYDGGVQFNDRFVFVRAAALLLAASLVLPSASRAQAISTAAGPATAATVAIDNFGQIGPTYYRGAQPKGRDYADLASLGVKTVVNLTSDDSDASEHMLTERAGMRYVQIPMTTHRAPTSDQLAEFLKVVSNPANRPVYVHCVGGRHRTGVMTAVYRMTHDGWSADRAFAEMKRYKFGADMLHPEFKAFVYAYRADAAATSPAAAAAGTKGGQ
jgi:protein tyrosine/serine phosphatase